MHSMFSAMASVLMTWLAMGASFVGIGRLLWRAVGLGSDSVALRSRTDQLQNAFWLGWAAVLAYLQFWNFWVPITWRARAFVMMVGIPLAITWAVRWYRGKVPAVDALRVSRRRRNGTLVVMLLVAVWLSNRVLGPGNADDSGLYHYNAIRWANEYPVVPGLGNLNAAFALNNASFLYHAMLNTGVWTGRGNHLGNGLLLLMFSWRSIASVSRVLDRRNPCRPVHIYDVMMLPVVAMLALGKDLSSPKTDLPPGLLLLVMVRLILAVWLERPPTIQSVRMARNAGEVRATSESSWRGGWILVLSVYAAAIVILKLSAGLLAVGVWVAGLYIWWRRDRPSSRTMLQSAMACLVCGSLFVGPWIVRNVILSGYPLYPAKVAAVDVEWRVPPPAVDFLTSAIRNQPKGNLAVWLHGKLKNTRLAPYAALMKPPFETTDGIHGLNWCRSWLSTLPISGPIEILLPLTICGIALMRRRQIPAATAGIYRSMRIAATSMWVGLSLVIIGWLGFWLWAGPDPRYGWAATWGLAGLCVAWRFREISNLIVVESMQSRRRLVLMSVLLVIPTFGYRLAVLKMQGQGRPLRQVPFQCPGSDDGFHPTPQTELVATINRYGVRLWVPADPGQPLTWGGPLPSTGCWPPRNEDLRQRTPTDLSKGFVTDAHNSLH